MSLRLVTGHAGEEHVTSADAAVMNMLAFGASSYVFNRGNKFAASIIDSNTIRIASGDATIQGRFVRQIENTYEDLTIDSGTTGKYRKDVVAIEYTKNTGTGVESAEFVVVKGAEASSMAAAVVPTLTSGDITEGGNANKVQFGLWTIPVSGITPQTPTKMFTLRDAPYDVANALREELLNKTYPVGAIYMSVVSTSPATLFGGTWSRLESRFLLGASSSYAAGSTGGEASHKLTTAEMPAHTHSISGTAASNGAHTHSVSITSGSAGNHTHAATVAGAGKHAHTYLRTYQESASSARVAGGSGTTINTEHYENKTENTGEVAAHTHAVTNASNGSHTHSVSGNTGSNGAHTHALSGTSGSTGGAGTHNNMPPYLSVYMWKRTA